MKGFLSHISQVVVQSSRDGFQAVRLFHLKLVEEHADSGITQCADESVRTGGRCTGSDCSGGTTNAD